MQTLLKVHSVHAVSRHLRLTQIDYTCIGFGLDISEHSCQNLHLASIHLHIQGQTLPMGLVRCYGPDWRLLYNEHLAKLTYLSTFGIQLG